MKYLVKKDTNFRKKQKSLELKKFCLKFFIIYILNYKQININRYLFLKFFSLQKSNINITCRQSKSRLVRRCVLTGRGRGSIRSVGNISRSPLKILLSMGLMPGYKKAVW